MIQFKKDYYYKLYDNQLDIVSYFKFKFILDNRVFCDGFEIYDGFYMIYDENYCDTVYFERYDIIVEEIDISVIVDYLPENNLDKIIYLRKQKIKSLLALARVAKTLTK